MPPHAEAKEPQTAPFQLPKPRIEARVTLGDKGRIVIPAAIREAMGASEGDMLVMHVLDRELHIITREAGMLRAQERAQRFAIPGKLMSDESIAERRAEALAEELEDVLRMTNVK